MRHNTILYKNVIRNLRATLHYKQNEFKKKPWNQQVLYKLFIKTFFEISLLENLLYTQKKHLGIEKFISQKEKIFYIKLITCDRRYICTIPLILSIV